MDLGLGAYFFIGICLGFIVRAYLRALKIDALKKQAHEREIARKRKLAELYGKSIDE